MGARLCGQASRTFGRVQVQRLSPRRASVLSALPVNGDERHASALGVNPMTSESSRVSPDHDSARITSPDCTMPRSPWLASVGMKEIVRGGAGRGEGGGEFGADMARFAEAPVTMRRPVVFVDHDRAAASTALAPYRQVRSRSEYRSAAQVGRERVP